MLSKIKKEFLTKRVGFGNSMLPLGERTDIDDLAIIALNSNDPSLLNLFEKLPTLQDLKKNKITTTLSNAVAAIKGDEEKNYTTKPGTTRSTVKTEKSPGN